MAKKIILLILFVALGWGFSQSVEFKTIAAGIAIFLLGMFSLEQGFKAFSGGVLENFLKKTTDTTFKSLSFGIVSTTLMQSSSLVSVITISFLSAGLIGLAQGIGIIFGANLGTTTGAWLVAGLGLKVDIAAYAMPMLVFGVIMVFQKGNTKLQGAGWALVGLGFLFLGIAYMKEGFETVGNQFDLSQFSVPGFKGLLIYTGIGIAATVVMQSSHATLILTITALAAGQVSYENALALAIGSNVGTTITAILGAINASVEGRRLAVAHLIFNLVTGALAIVFIKQFATAVDWTSDLIGIASDDLTLKFAVFHTLFNLTGVLIMLPLIGTLVTVLEKVLRDKVEPEDRARVLFINKSALEFPDTALEVIIKETIHMAINAFGILAHGINLHRTDIVSDTDIEATVANSQVLDQDVDDLYQRRVKPLYSEIIDFSTQAEANMSTDQLNRLSHMKQAAWHIVGSVKAMNEMQKNVDLYTVSDNAYIKREYNSIRLEIARLLRTLFDMNDELSPTRKLEQLKKIRLSLEEKDIVSNGVIDKLIREQRITPEMATSLMNDTGFAYDIQKNLIDAAEIIYAHSYSREGDLELSEEDIDKTLLDRRHAILEELAGEEESIDRLTRAAGSGSVGGNETPQPGS